MFVYIYDIGWAGCFFAIATNDEEGIRLIKEDYKKHGFKSEIETSDIIKIDVREGFTYYSAGDT